MEISAEIVAILVTIFIALLATAFGYGTLTQRVKGNRFDIEGIKEEFKRYCDDNKADHKEITQKLDKILQNNSRGNK